MAYSELVKNFNKIRDYMREFYVYGFKSREEFTSKSARSYDDERRRLESWLGDYMKFRQTPDGKNVFLSIDSRVSHHNPLFKAWKTKSFTDGDITLHFVIFDILSKPETSMTTREILDEIDTYLSGFSQPKMFDESTVRKKLQEYVAEGLLMAEKEGKTVRYHRVETGKLPDPVVLDYFSEVLPCGVIGSFLLDKAAPHQEPFVFKHHYITGALDSEVLYTIFNAIREHRYITMEYINRQKERITEDHVTPLKVMVSAQNGRQYLMAYVPRYQRITAFRTDNFVEVRPDEVCEQFEELQHTLDGMLPHMWGVSTQGHSGDGLEHVEFTVRYGEDEKFIRNRLEREKRCGTVEHLDSHTSRFSADVYDASELIPWIRTFICRITDIRFSSTELEKQFQNDLADMYALYGLGDE